MRDPPPPPSLVDRLIRFCLEQKLVVALFVILVVAWGVIVAPFDWRLPWLPRHPIAVDAIPDIGENQQIVFTEWMGRSPRDVDDQVTYPLTVALLGIPGVKTIRSYSMFGFSMIYLIFEEAVRFEDSQNRIIARLNGLPAGTVPLDVKPALGPYATALGQIFWYTLEGRDPDGKPAGGWDLQELRAIQDWTVRYHLQAAEGITEVAAVGGFVQEYQVDVNPDAMRVNGVTLEEVFNAVRQSNAEVGARQLELNRVEYLIRARGFLRSVEDLEAVVVKVNNHTPICIRDVATVTLGPAMREGALDKDGAEAVGGVVVVRHGFNPLAAIKNVKEKMAELAPSLPAKALVDYQKTSRADLENFARGQGFEAFSAGALNQAAWVAWLRAHPRDRWPEGMTTSQITIVPFYDRTGLIHETLGTLNSALYEQVLITTIVVLIMAGHLGMSLLVSAVMPLAVFLAFIAMKLLRVEANIVSLSGIAIAIGTMVDMGIIMSQNILQHLAEAPPGENRLDVIWRAACEVGGALTTAIATTVVGFLPIFFMTGAEGRLFLPLAFTKTFCLVGSAMVGITVVPAVAHLLLGGKPLSPTGRRVMAAGLALAGLFVAIRWQWWVGGAALLLAGLYQGLLPSLPDRWKSRLPWLANAVAILLVGILLARHWMPLGLERGWSRNLAMVALLIGSFQLLYHAVRRYYERILRWCLAHKALFLALPLMMVVVGYLALIGTPKLLGFIPSAARRLGLAPEVVTHSRLWTFLSRTFPGFGKEFMPPLDEGSFLYMPTTMPHASIGEALDVVAKQDMALRAIPEVESVVGKIGRVDSALDPAPVNMVETVINYKPEYATGPDGRPFRQWRDHIQSPEDIWKEITMAAQVPGSTTAPRLQPIAARLVMLQSGMRAPMGIKVKGPNLEDIERAGLLLEQALKEVPQVEPATVIADRIVGKPYLEIDIKRDAIARYGLTIAAVQETIEVAVGGMTLTRTVEGRMRFPVRVRYQRERRDSLEELGRIVVATPAGAQVPLLELAEIRYLRGPEAIKSEDTFLVSYVLFDKKPGLAEVDVVEACQRQLEAKRRRGELPLPSGVTYRFAGNYENQIHAQKTLAVILPLTLFIIFMLIYFQFRSVITSGLVFLTIFVCWGGGLVFLWLYGQSWFMDFSIFGMNMRNLFHIHPINMSIAVWVGFLALFGIASDDAVVICTYLDQRFGQSRPGSITAIREATIYAGARRAQACLMTTATTVLALLPVLASTGRGADIMAPMSLPVFGGMVAEVLTMFLAPVLYCAVRERRLKNTQDDYADKTI